MNLVDKKNYNIFIGLMIFLAIAAGMLFRLKGLGTWPFAVDEYYFVKAVQNILKYGVPRYESGGYYERGILQQYLTAFIFLLGAKAEFGSRIIPVVFNLLAIPGLYLLMKKISGKVAAAVLVVVFCFSVWEVEFARFARMYSFFQTIFVWYLYFLYKNIVENDDKATKWLWILSFISIFVYEGSIFLVVLNFLPVIWDKEKDTINIFTLADIKRTAIPFIISLILLILAYKFLTTNFRFINENNTLPPDVVEYYKSQRSAGGFRKPILLLPAIFSSSLWIFLFLIVLSINAFLFSRIFKSSASNITKAAVFILFTLSVFNLLGLIIISLIIFILIGWLEPKDIVSTKSVQGQNKKFAPSGILINLLIVFSINFIFWVAFAVKTTAWHKFYPGQTFSGTLPSIKMLIKTAVNYPNFYETIVIFRNAVPVTTVITVILFCILSVYIIANYYKAETRKYRFLLFILVSLVLAVDFLNLTFFTTRYFFFLYPLVMILAIIGAKIIAGFLFNKSISLKYATYCLFIIVLLVFSEDFKLYHLVKIDDREINFRNHMSLAQKSHFYPRWDMRTPAEIVNKYAKPSDIVISNEQVNDFYLKELDYIYVDYRGRLNGVSVNSGKKELWTNANLIYTDKDFLKLLFSNNNTKWLIVNKERGVGFLEKDNFFKNFKKYSIYANPDSSAILYKIPSNIESEENNKGSKKELVIEQVKNFK